MLNSEFQIIVKEIDLTKVDFRKIVVQLLQM